MYSLAVDKDMSPRCPNGTAMRTPFLIGVAGGTASGKTTVCHKIVEKIGQDSIDQRQQQVICISQDSFYKELNEEDKAKAFKGQYNFDHPDAFDIDLLYPTLKDILDEKIVKVPKYDFKTNSRFFCVYQSLVGFIFGVLGLIYCMLGERSMLVGEYITIYPADVVLIEGILVFYFPQIRDLFHMKLFVDTDADTRLSRRVLRDTLERERDLEHILQQYTTFVKPAFEEFCLPTKKYADIIIPRGADNTVAIDLIVRHVQDLIKSKDSSGKQQSKNHSGSDMAVGKCE